MYQKLFEDPTQIGAAFPVQAWKREYRALAAFRSMATGPEPAFRVTWMRDAQDDLKNLDQGPNTGNGLRAGDGKEYVTMQSGAAGNRTRVLRPRDRASTSVVRG